MSSSASVAAIPYHAAYSASKAALEHYCDGLRYEVEPQGIAVSCVQATGVNTGASASVHLGAEPVAVYEPARREAVERFRRTQTEGPPPTAIVEPLVAAVEAERPRPVIRVGREAKLLPWLKALAPERLFRAQVLKTFAPPSP